MCKVRDSIGNQRYMYIFKRNIKVHNVIIKFQMHIRPVTNFSSRRGNEKSSRGTKSF